MQTLDFVSGLHNCLEFSQPLQCLYQEMQTRKTFSFLNNGISSEEFSMHYIKVDEIIRMVSKYGPGALMTKFDVADMAVADMTE